MTSIAEIREKYPQYSDMSDEQLATALHGKYYADMPYEEFSAKIGMTKPRTMTQELGRQLGLTGRAVVEAVAAAPLTALEGGIGAGNLIVRAMGGEGNLSATDVWNAGVNRVFPKPETTLEKAVQIGGTMIAGARLPGQMPLPNQPATAADKVIAEGAKHQVPVYYDDVGGTVAKRINIAAEWLGPVGTGTGRKIQAEATKAAAGEMVEKYAANSSDDVPVLIQKGLQAKLAGLRRGAANLYSRVDRALSGTGPVDTTNFKTLLQRRIAEEQTKGSVANQDLIATLQKYADAPAGDFALMRAMRSSLGDDIAGYYTGKGAGAIGQKGVDTLQEAKKALDAAMEGHARGVGGPAYEAWRRADTYYRTNIVPFKEAGFKDLVKTAEPEKAWRYLLANDTESRAVRMFNGLDRAGRQAVKFGLLKEARDKAMNPNGSFSPARFAKYIGDHEKVVGTFFKGAERADIDGFVNLMRHVERAGQFAENPPTGQRLIPYLLTYGFLTTPKSAAAAATGGLTVRGLFQTAAGRNFLLSAGKLKPGSPEMERLLESLTRYAAGASVSAQANADAQ